MPPKIYMTIGISGSGKSRFAKYFCERNEVVELNADEIRKKLGDISSQDNNNLVFKALESKTTAHLAGGHNVLLSNTNLHLRGIKSICSKYPFNKVIIFIMDDSTDLELCKKRVQNDVKNNIERSNVPMDVIEHQFDNFTSLILELRKKELPVEIHVVKQDYAIEDF